MSLLMLILIFKCYSIFFLMLQMKCYFLRFKWKSIRIHFVLQLLSFSMVKILPLTRFHKLFVKPLYLSDIFYTWPQTIEWVKINILHDVSKVWLPLIKCPFTFETSRIAFSCWQNSQAEWVLGSDSSEEGTIVELLNYNMM